MQFVWVTSGTSSDNLGGRENSPPAPRCPANAEVQPAEESIHIVSKEASATGGRVSENLERNIGEPCATLMSGEKSHKPEPSPTRLSGEEEPSRHEPS
uniref:Rrm/rnp domain n=1 Tax=Rhizophora mucronata TaxID=61149 RepID=A0A2P2ILW3_RHIMU